MAEAPAGGWHLIFRYHIVFWAIQTGFPLGVGMVTLWPPADMRYPTDMGLLNEAREKLDEIIDTVHKANGLASPNYVAKPSITVLRLRHNIAERGCDVMPEIIPIRDLRDTTKISELCHSKQEPIFITKNGYGDLVIMSIKTYERELARVDLYRKLAEAEAQIKNGEPLLEAEEVFAKMKKKYGREQL